MTAIPTSKRLLFAATLLQLSVAANADDDHFIGLGLSLGPNYFDSTRHNGSVGTGITIDGEVDGAIEQRNTEDAAVAGLSLTAGQTIFTTTSARWSIQGDLTWRYRSDWDTVMATPSISTITNMFANVSTTSAVVALVREAPLAGRWQWQAGLTTGLAYHVTKADYIEREVPGVSAEFRADAKQSDIRFAWGVVAGVHRPIGEHWSLGIGYRFLDLGEVRVSGFDGRPANLETEMKAHELQLTLRRHW